MAAPNVVGHHESDRADDAAAADRGQPVEEIERARADRIAELAARLATIEGRDRGSARGEPGAGSSRSSTTATSGIGSGVGHGAADLDRIGNNAEARSAPEPGSKRTAAPIGSGGAAGRRRPGPGGRPEPGGHPEDAMGDPETVAKAICLRLLTAAARPRAALESALRQRGIPDEVADTVLNRFVEVGLIDDRAYAEAFVAAKHRDRALGVTALRTELRRKGVDDSVAAAALGTLDQDAERERATALISRRVDAAMSDGAPTARRRLVGLLARRGYSADLARQVVDQVLAEYGAEQDDRWLD